MLGAKLFENEKNSTTKILEKHQILLCALL